jgi:hypothetical protein
MPVGQITCEQKTSFQNRYIIGFDVIFDLFNEIIWPEEGATTFSIKTFRIMTLGKMTLSIMTLSMIFHKFTKIIEIVAIQIQKS